MEVITQIGTQFHWEIAWEVISGYKEVFTLFIIGYLMHFKPKQLEIKSEQLVTRLPMLAKSVLIVFTIWIVIQTKSSGIQPFIYFQF